MAQRQSHKNAPKNANNAPTYAHVAAGNAGPGGQPQAQPSHEAPPASSNPTGQTIGCDSTILAAPVMPPTSGAGQPPPPAVNPDDRVSVLGRRHVPLPGSDAQPQDASQGAVPAHSEKPPPAAHPGTRETNGYRFIKAESSQSEDASQGAVPAPSAGNPAHSEKPPPAENHAPRTGKGHRVLEQDSSQPEDASQGAGPAPPAETPAAIPAPAAKPPPPGESLSPSEQSSSASGSTSKDGSKLPPPVMLYFPVSKELVRATMKIVKEGGAFKYLSVRFFVYPKGKSASYKDIFGDLLHWRSDQKGKGKKGKAGATGEAPKEPIVYRKRPLYLKIARENLCYMMQTQTEITLCLVTGGAGGQARLFTRLIFLSPRNLPHYREVFGELKSQFSSKPLPGEFTQLSSKSGAGKVTYALTNEAPAGGEGAYYKEMYKNYLFSGYRRQMDKLAHRLIKPKHGGGESDKQPVDDELEDAEAPEQAGAGKKAKKAKKPKDASQDKGNFEHLYFEYIKAERKHPWFRGHVPMLTWDDPKVVLAKVAPAQAKEASAGDWKSKGQVYFSRSETWHPLVGFKFNADPNPKPVPGQFQQQQAQQQQAQPQPQANQQGQQVPGKRPPRRNRFTRPNFDFTFEYKIGDQVVTQVVNYLHIEYYKMTAIPGYNSLTVHILHMMQCIHFQFEQYEHCAAMYEELKGWLGKPDRIDINLNAGRIYKALNPGLVGPKTAPPPHPDAASTSGASPHPAQGPKKGLTKEKLNELIHEACYPAGAAHPPSCIEYGTTRDRFSCAPKPKPGDAPMSPVSSPAPGPNGRGVSPGGSESGFNGKRKLTRREVAHNRTCALIVLDIKRTLRQLLNRLAHAQLEESTAPNATSINPQPGQEVYDDKVVVLKAGQEALKGKYAEVRNILRKFYATAPESFVIFPKERSSEAPGQAKVEPENAAKGSEDASKKKSSGAKKDAPKKPFFNHKPQYEWLYQGLTAPF